MSTLLRYLSVLTDAGWVALDDSKRGVQLAHLTASGAAQLRSLDEQLDGGQSVVP